jgi:hypothetical protein
MTIPGASPRGAAVQAARPVRHSFDAISASFATVFMLRAVPVLAAGILSLDFPIPLP